MWSRLFWSGNLKEEVYLEHWPGFEKADPAKIVCLLIKALHDFKQAYRERCSKIDALFVRTSRKHWNNANECMPARQDHCRILVTVLYVDHLLIACVLDSKTTYTINRSCCRFKMKDCNESRRELEMEIIGKQNNKSLFLVQSWYASKVEESFGMESTKGCTAPV